MKQLTIVKQPVYEGYGFEHPHLGKFVVQDGRWWQITVSPDTSVTQEWQHRPTTFAQAWLNTFTTICPMPERPMVPVQ